MGFAENKKLAKDINTVNTECADRLGALMTQMSGRMNTANRILEGIASEETRTVYKPSQSSGDIVCSNSKVSLYKPYQSPAKQYTEKHVLANVFQAKYNGEVTFYVSCNWHQGRIGYTIRQTYPVEAVMFEGSIGNLYNGNDGAGSEIINKNIPVVKDAVYQIEINLTVNASPGVNFYGSADATASIRAIEETITGTKTQYYYPAEGAPTIWSDNTVQDMTTEKTVDYSFTPECDGVALLTISLSADPSSFPDYGVAELTVNCPGENSQTLEVSKKNNILCSSQILLYKGKPHTIHIYNSNWRFVIDYVAISAIKTTSFPIVVPFKNVENPVSVTIELDGLSKTGYIVKKLPQVPGATYMITSDAAAYPVFKSHCLMYNMVKNKVDYHLWKNTNDEGWDYQNRVEAYNTTMIVAVVFIDGEYCLFAHGSKAAEQLKYISGISATLF